MADRVSIGVVGLGYWGPNLARNFAALPDAEVRWLCDASGDALERQRVAHPSAQLTNDLDDLLTDDALDAVVVATMSVTHAELAIRVLEAGKHCFVEKPMATTLADAERVVEAATRSDGMLMVGHLLEYHPGMVRLKELVDSGELGELRYAYTQRLNLGKVRSDENTLWSLGPHDVSTLISIAGAPPERLEAHGACYMHEDIEDVVFAFMRFPGNFAAHMHLSWLDPHKERRITVVGSERMAAFDDMRAEGKLSVYDKGFDQDFSSYGEYIARSGDIRQPHISNEEPLRVECRHFVECIVEGRRPRTDEQNGLRVVRVLAGLQDGLDAARRGVDQSEGALTA